MNEIARVKKEVKLAQWVEMVRNRNESGLTVTDWCKENGINLKTYYYRLKRVRQAVCSEIEQHDIVPAIPAEEPQSEGRNIELLVGDVKISLPDNFNENTLRRLLGLSQDDAQLSISGDEGTFLQKYICHYRRLGENG